MDKDLTITKKATGWQTHEYVLNIISIKGQIKATKRHRYRVFRILKSKRLIILSICKDMAHLYTAAGNQFGSFSKLSLHLPYIPATPFLVSTQKPKDVSVLTRSIPSSAKLETTQMSANRSTDTHFVIYVHNEILLSKSGMSYW